MVPRNGVDDGIVNHDTIRCTLLEREERSSTKDNISSNETAENSFFPHGMVIDDACSQKWLAESVQETRTNLPLNDKRPTVDRRFYCDTTREVICQPLESIVRHALQLTGSSCSNISSNNGESCPTFLVYCNKYLRFLEYKTVGGELLPHRDGIKTCEDTGTKSTHTLLLFLSDCEVGGETLIMDDTAHNWSKEKHLVLDVYEAHDENMNEINDLGDCDSNGGKKLNKRRIRYTANDKYNAETADSGSKGSTPQVFRLRDASIRSIGSNSSDDDADDGDDDNAEEGMIPPRHVSVGIQPSEGRILLFPHHWPHAGAMCQSVPKIALRAELTIAKA